MVVIYGDQPPIAVVCLAREDNRYTVSASHVDQHCRIDRELIPNWGALTNDTDYQGKDWATPEEAWDAAQTMLRRLLAWGWELRNPDNVVIDTYGKPLHPAN